MTGDGKGGTPDVAPTVRERFRRAVRQAGGSAKAAKLLGITRAYVDMICQGVRRPGMVTAHAVERAFGIRMQDWLTPTPAIGEPPRGTSGGGQ